ncbi:MAG: 6-phosphogluconolactonase [Candidatus Saccharimonadales bacterium]
MQILESQTATVNKTADFVAKTLAERLRCGQSVLWLVPGGSAATVAVRVSQKLKTVPQAKLTVSLTDERFGRPAHTDSNWEQLGEAGFRLNGAALQPVLQGKSLAQTVLDFERTLEKELRQADYKIGLFGIGEDGHTAGILLKSVALKTKMLVASFQGPDFARITITPQAIASLDLAIVYALGKAKYQAIRSLKENQSLAKQPAQALKQAKRLVIFTDQSIN